MGCQLRGISQTWRGAYQKGQTSLQGLPQIGGGLRIGGKRPTPVEERRELLGGTAERGVLGERRWGHGRSGEVSQKVLKDAFGNDGQEWEGCNPMRLPLFSVYNLAVSVFSLVDDLSSTLRRPHVGGTLGVL